MSGVQSFGRRRGEEDDDDQVTRIPAIVLPPARLRLELDLDQAKLTELFKTIHDGVYQATRLALDEAFEDFTAEQQERAAAQDGAEDSPPAAAESNG